MNTNLNNTIENTALVAAFGLPKQFDGIVSQFLATEVGETGWTWRDAMEATIERGDVVDIAATPLMRFLQSRVSKGWSWSNAIEAAIEAGHQIDLSELPLEAFIKADEAAKQDATAPESDEFEALTGWSYGDAVAMAAECRFENRIFKRGRKH